MAKTRIATTKFDRNDGFTNIFIIQFLFLLKLIFDTHKAKNKTMPTIAQGTDIANIIKKKMIASIILATTFKKDLRKFLNF